MCDVTEGADNLYLVVSDDATRGKLKKTKRVALLCFVFFIKRVMLLNRSKRKKNVCNARPLI